MPSSKPDLKKDKKVLALRNKGLSYREIGKIVEEDVKNVYIRYKRAVGELSTGWEYRKVARVGK